MEIASTIIINISIQSRSQNISDDKTSPVSSILVMDAEMRNRTVLASCLMFSAGVVGNVLALVLMATSPQEQRKTMFYKLMAGLAFTDLVGTCATSPVVITIYVTSKKLDTDMPLCNYFSFMMIFAGFATMSLVCAMAIERYICLCHPYAYHCRLSKSYAKYAFIVSWLLSVLIATLPLMGLGHNTVQFPRTWCFFNSTSRQPKDIAFNVIYASISFIAILGTLCCNVAAIWTVLALKRRQKALSAARGPGIKGYRNLAQRYAELHMVVMLLGVTVVFTFCFGPLMVKLRWKIISVFKFLLGIQRQPSSASPVHDGDSPIFPRRQHKSDQEMSCLRFCFHCMCDPPVQRSSVSLAAASTSRAGQSNRSPSYMRRVVSADSVLRVPSRTCIITQPSPSEELLLHSLPPFKTEVVCFGINDCQVSLNGI
ncbi:unnamed protein product [Candidula unifasciata]|uniref:G-protein coupled receptors family 1 profile domain-containing protein n=1 Tax=Candidula unifasciata TaxID=100452 RepID=A0A8S4A9G7_9EUPU|nr:unnamed protein product [Candidula unifasciata]